MNQERRSVESPQTNAIRLPAISLPVAERQGYQQLTTTPVASPDSRPAFLSRSERATVFSSTFAVSFGLRQLIAAFLSRAVAVFDRPGGCQGSQK